MKRSLTRDYYVISRLGIPIERLISLAQHAHLITKTDRDENLRELFKYTLMTYCELGLRLAAASVNNPGNLRECAGEMENHDKVRCSFGERLLARRRGRASDVRRNVEAVVPLRECSESSVKRKAPSLAHRVAQD